MSADTVKIRHDESNAEAEVLRSAYEKIWKDRGWTLVEDGSSEGTSAQQPAPRRSPQQPDTSGTGTQGPKE